MLDKELIVSAPGKVILHGEHAVVHGKLALAVALNMRTYLRVGLSADSRVSLNLPNINTFLSWDLSSLKTLMPAYATELQKVDKPDHGLIQQLREFMGVLEGSMENSTLATLAFLYLYVSIFAGSRDWIGITVTVWSELPTGAGLGSSAAYVVCLSAALLSACGVLSCPVNGCQISRWNREELEIINKWAFQGEKIIHGNPSGVDNAVGTWGGALRYLSGDITPLNSVPILRILLTNTQVPRSTKVLVAGVKDKILKFPAITIPVLDSINAISHECEKILGEMATGPTDKHYDVLEELFDINQHHLNVIGVGHPSLDKLCQITLAHGLHSKLTGAGGGGCGITLLRPGTDSITVDKVIKELEDCGYDCWETNIGAPGVQLHCTSSVKEEISEILWTPSSGNQQNL
ncbi:mevalonate kinase [Erpetoichthys calabaricus]|uniref:Mevalonate kinase n=1 Tax=Erpetoichthys calabaricus TaxID=27687 RepID=A0A8C4T847_ERPCA|nr:mevalonate kinase [Erpetoichthys calabaricus]XP_051777341.1 mevalonate kinase [Erpetoichthys calabaricus]